MKRILSLLLFVFPLTLFSQQSHTVIGFDHGFNPDTLYMNSGDTVQFISQGYHGMTEIDSIDWVNNTSNHNGGFWVGLGASTSDMWFTINSAGKYYYICQPHATMGMKGVIYVNNSNSVPEHFNPSNFSLRYADDKLHLSYVKADEFILFDASGKLIFSTRVQGQSAVSYLGPDVISGTYIGLFRRKGQSLSVKKVGIVR